MKALLFALLPALGCDAPADSAGENGGACTALQTDGELDLRLSAAEGEIEGVLTDGGARPLEDGTVPVAVEVIGSWDTEPSHSSARIHATGALTVRVNLAGADWAAGADDTRGPLARAATAAALRYAAGSEPDSQGCFLEDRRERPAAPVVLGISNGGNLAMATLADSVLTVPEPVGLILWETPAGAQFATREHGNEPALYSPGLCTLGDSGITCPVTPSALARSLALPCFDLDADGACGPDDVTPETVADPETGEFASSPSFARLFSDAGLLPSTWEGEDAARSFWVARDAAQAAPAVVQRFPELPILLIASEEDHVLKGLPDHPHVVGLGQALQAAGARWVRVNPGAAWSGLDTENEPNAPLDLAVGPPWLVPESDEDPLNAMLGDATAELYAHTIDDSW